MENAESPAFGRKKAGANVSAYSLRPCALAVNKFWLFEADIRIERTPHPTPTINVELLTINFHLSAVYPYCCRDGIPAVGSLLNFYFSFVQHFQKRFLPRFGERIGMHYRILLEDHLFYFHPKLII